MEEEREALRNKLRLHGQDWLHHVDYGAGEESTQEKQLWREREGINCHYASIYFKKQHNAKL